MASHELDRLGQIVDDAKLTVEELQDDDSQSEEQLDQLHDSLEDAGDAVDALVEEKKSTPHRTFAPADRGVLPA